MAIELGNNVELLFRISYFVMFLSRHIEYSSLLYNILAFIQGIILNSEGLMVSGFSVRF